MNVSTKTPKIERAPKATAWTVGCGGFSVGVFDAAKGLTAFEAWELSGIPGNPHFSEVRFQVITPFPVPNAGIRNVEVLADAAFKKLRGKRR